VQGKFLVGVFNLSNLRFLNVGGNEGLTGYFSGFTWNSPLETLILSGTSFSGELPASIENIGFLTSMSMKSCNFSGSVPSLLGNLTKLTFS
jgi:hypothetical protein